MLKPFVQRLRSRILAGINQRRLRQGVSGFGPDTTPIFFIFTPEISHLAPYCIPKTDERFTSVLVMNAVSPDDVQWIRSIHPDKPVIELKHSLSRNSQSMLSHGEVLNDLFSVVTGNFCIQDPDCFVTDESFWNEVALKETNFAGGPFWSRAFEQEHDLPYTYFVMFNFDAYQTITSKYGIDTNVIHRLPKHAQRQAKSVGYDIGQYPNRGKDYFDTLQAFWVLSLAEGMEFKKMPGERECIYHIGGTSYLHKSDIDLSHWDYWPLSVQYFNLRILESAHLARFRKRYAKLIETYNSADELLSINPEFSTGWRRIEIDTIVNSFAGV